MSQTSIVYLGRIIYLNSIDIHEQINTRTDKCELHSGHFYHNRMLPTIYRFVTWADQKEWKWSNDHCFHFSIDFHSFFFLFWLSVGKLYRSVSIFKDKRVKKEKKKKRRHIFYSHFQEFSPVSAELSLAEVESFLTADDPWHRIERFQFCIPEIEQSFTLVTEAQQKNTEITSKKDGRNWRMRPEHCPSCFHLESFNLISFLLTNRSLT